ncbi:ATPase [Clostridia bacterium]|nr:ATPase [Clostridia bacterium]
MKRLSKLLLVHWHYFTQEIIEFGELNFLTGRNASGKSTIIDAMQLILLGDTSGSFFNKAASGRGNRTLKGYLMGELGDDEESGFRYLRTGRFTSYIALEFFDDEKDRHFTVGCCFDTFSENDMQKLFFLYDGELHKTGFLKEKTPMDIMALRIFLKEHYAGHFETTDVGRDFRTKLYGKLGGLRERFAGLLKKAVSFNPNVDIQKFISDFVCDTQQTVDVSHMQENIRSYKRLEAESDVLVERMALLEKIVNTYQNYTTSKNNEMLYSFLIDRASADMKIAELALAKSNAADLKEQLSALKLKIADARTSLVNLREQKDVLNAQLLSDSSAQALEQIDRQIREKEAQILMLQKDYDKAMEGLFSRIVSWRGQTESMLKKMEGANGALLQAGISSRICDICEEGKLFLKKIGNKGDYTFSNKTAEIVTQAKTVDNISKSDYTFSNKTAETITQLGEIGLREYSNAVDGLKKRSIELSSRIQDEEETLIKQKAELAAEQKSLESGIYRFPQDVLDLKDALTSRLRIIAKEEVNVRIVAEAAEIKNDRWRNVIEGYLHTQKFYILVPEKYFQDAMGIYDKIKRQKSIYGTGIVDIEKLKKKNQVADPGSLAEEIETDDLDVKAFLDYTLGRVQKCDHVAKLRNFPLSVTDEGMLYQNFVVRAMHPKRWDKPAIGQGAIQRRLVAVKEKIALLSGQITACADIKSGLENTGKLSLLSDSEIEKIISVAKNIVSIPVLKSDLESLGLSRAAIDTSAIDSLKNRIAVLNNDIIGQDGQLRTDEEKRIRTDEHLLRLQNETIPSLSKELEVKEEEIAVQYSEDWIKEMGQLRYEKELSGRGMADHIFIAFPREQSRAKNAKEDAWEILLDLRRNYNEKYKMGLDSRAKENDAYEDALRELKDNQLPDYLTRITDARTKAFEQFQEDFISRLQHNMNNAKRQIDELNSALKGATFGEDSYRFRIIPKPEYKRYYDMIVDEMITQGGYNLLSIQFNTKYKDEIADLFAIITNEDGVGGATKGAEGSTEYERRVHEFTDFRTYLSFDLEVFGQDGESQRLSKTMGKKSGGETQTPFYIAVLASFAQLYRAGRDKTYKTARLIIFDEAFSKMDGERIVRSVELLRKFQFQVILSAPPDKIGDIAALVDKNLCVLREGKRTCVRSFDKTRLEGLMDE